MSSPPTTADLILLWAKRGRGPHQPGYHPLPCHLLDVAAVARALWADVLAPAARRGLADALGLDEPAAGRWLALWAGLHDLGKASPVFQKLDPGAPERLKRTGLVWPNRLDKAHHGTISAAALQELLVSDLGLAPEFAPRLAAVIGGHHGRFPSARDVEDLTNGSAGNKGWQQARAALVRWLAEVLEVPFRTPPTRLGNAPAMALAGLISVADWIGSAEEFFPRAVPDELNPPSLDLTAYAARAATSADTALHWLGWTGWVPEAGTPSFARLFPSIAEPYPIQRAAIDLAPELDGPGIVIVEAPMGEGKTEAAMYLADAWTASQGYRGCYFALPTQATSDQIFGRVRDFLVHRYPEQTVNLQLLHGHASLSAEFASLRARQGRLLEPAEVYDGERGPVLAEGTVMAAEWFTHRKRGLLAPFGVGTIDQALLAALQTRHVFVRLAGLAEKTVIVDEVHAYDTYMSALLQRLLEWLGALGAPVVLLSATLPRARREELLRAYLRGLGGAAEAELPSAPYPRLTWATATATGCQGVGVSARSTRTVRLEWVDGTVPKPKTTDFTLGARLQAALAEGGCAVVICNTVRRAQEVYRALEPHFSGLADDGWPVLDLLHARFLYAERQQREWRTLIRFGKPGGSVDTGEGEPRPVRRPDRAVLVATQIVEQSLDLDFDLMVTDLAPADLVLQRSGRLHRHQRPRPPGLQKPALWICRPEGNDDVPTFDSGTSRVYDGHILLRSWLELKDRCIIRSPNDFEELIEAVYDDTRPPPDNASSDLRLRWDETRRDWLQSITHATAEAKRSLIVGPGYPDEITEVFNLDLTEDDPSVHRSLRALTRMSKPSIQLVILTSDSDAPLDHPSRPHLEQVRYLLYHSVGITHPELAKVLQAESPPADWRRSALLRYHRVRVLDERQTFAIGSHELKLDEAIGLVSVKKGKGDGA